MPQLCQRSARVIAAAGLLALTALTMDTATARAETPAEESPDVAAPFVADPNAVPGVAPDTPDVTDVYLDHDGQVIPVNDVTVGSSWWNPCTPISGRDNPHRSSTGVAVSGHGWWDKGSCSKSRANVYNCLYEYYTDRTWRRKACSATVVLAPGGGSGNRSTARKDCDSTALTSWRNHVDVDVIDESDTSEWPYNQGPAINCRVF